ncbi:hypothetical protein GVN16_03730 [Emticicia sp. CRIBPO]|uniref:alpha/beta hydrolase family protein n=1 Tax=Emticicia sp. CRIBPO TaxID=2683258 RepID=UPI0014134936|nr:CocE/NonD family hydrolase [Emticicia sp. CRIBPO]NBA84852.1 hypothetical protein [Emticicia sp. CRIBPO]
MKKMFPLIIALIVLACTSSQKEQSKTYAAGFQTFRIRDVSRFYKPGTDTADVLYYRPVDIDVWYPAQAGADSALLFRDLLGLLEQRANYYTDSFAGNGLTKQVAGIFCDIFKCSDTTRLLNFKTGSIKNASPVKGKFPLVVYMASYNGMGYENFTLLEELAQKGFVVISVNSIGRFPGDMTMKREDMMEQVYDAITALDFLKQNLNIDFLKIGILGYSWGGLSGAVLADKIPGVRCLVSFEGSEFHHYGQSKEEDADFDGIRYHADFKKMKISVPYLRLESAPASKQTQYDSVYNFAEKVSGNKQIIKIDSAQHHDFGCIPQTVLESGHCPGTQHYPKISKLAVDFLTKHLKD